MIFGAEIALLMLGIYGLCTGKLVLSKQCVVRGSPARLLSIIACAPLPLSFAGGFFFARSRAAAIWQRNGSLHWILIAIEVGILLGCVAVIYLIGWMLAEPSAADDGDQHRKFLDHSDAKPVPTATGSSVKASGIALVLGIAVFFAGRLLFSDSFFAGPLNETPDADIDAMPPAPPSAGPVLASLLPAPWQPRVERMLQFNRRTLAGAYDKVGKKNPLWDEHAHTAMELTARHFSNVTDPGAQPKDIRVATQQALAAGCNDPLILYLHFRFADATATDAELEQGFAKAARAMEWSKYPPFRRASALWKAAERKLKRAEETAAKMEAKRLIVAILHVLRVSAREDERGHDLEGIWYDLARDAFASYKQFGHDPRQWWRTINDMLATEKALEATRLLLEGDCHIQWAWEARGRGYLSTVTSERMQKFDEHLTLARNALEKSWQLDPAYGKPATFMLTVELGQARGRAEMEQWFERAIQYDPSVEVCGQKLEWLHPKWHGSEQEMLAFGRACRDSQNWERAFPLIMAETHQRIADMLQSDAAKARYFRQPEVAADMVYVYAKSVERYPEDVSLRSRYAYYCSLCGHPRRAHRQFERLGDKLWWGDNFTETLMKQARANAAKQVAG